MQAGQGGGPHHPLQQQVGHGEPERQDPGRRPRQLEVVPALAPLEGGPGDGPHLGADQLDPAPRREQTGLTSRSPVRRPGGPAQPLQLLGGDQPAPHADGAEALGAHVGGGVDGHALLHQRGSSSPAPRLRVRAPVAWAWCSATSSRGTLVWARSPCAARGGRRGWPGRRRRRAGAGAARPGRAGAAPATRGRRLAEGQRQEGIVVRWAARAPGRAERDGAGHLVLRRAQARQRRAHAAGAAPRHQAPAPGRASRRSRRRRGAAPRRRPRPAEDAGDGR